jgi:RNA-directed DNA polymerase
MARKRATPGRRPERGEARRRFRAVLHACEKFDVTKEASRHDEPRAYLLGFASYVAMVQPEAGATLRAEVLRLLARTAGS